MLSVAIPVGVFRGVAFSCRKSQNKSKNQLSLSPFPSPPCSLQAIKPGKTRTGNKNKGRQHRCGQCHNAIAVRAQLWPYPAPPLYPYPSTFAAPQRVFRLFRLSSLAIHWAAFVSGLQLETKTQKLRPAQVLHLTGKNRAENPKEKQ